MTRLGAIGLVLLVSAAARAQEAPRPSGEAPPPVGLVLDDATEASLVNEGIKLRQEKRDAAAFETFSRAWERFHTPRSEAHLGIASQALGRWALAETHLVSALEASDDRWIVAHHRELEAALKVVRKRLGSLDVLAEVPAGEAAPGGEILVDGQLQGKLPLAAPLRLPAGTVVVQVQAPGYLPVQRPVTIEAEQLARESFRLVRAQATLPPAGPPAAAQPAPPSSVELLAPPTVVGARASAEEAPHRRLGVIWGGIGVTLLGAGLSTWSGLDTLSARDRYVESPTESGYRDGVSRQRRTNMLLVGTGVLAAATVAWGLITSWGSR
jgi:hypothetical protein